VHTAPVEPTDDAARAARRIMTDDGFNVGVLYRGNRHPYQPEIGTASQEVADLEEAFLL